MSRVRTTFVLIVMLVAAAAAAARDEAPRTEAYREGQRAIEQQDWDAASRIFAKIASKPGDETDAALYWKAYADWKRAQKKDALDGLRQLLASYPKSAWADDAKALELEIRDGKGARGAGAGDDEDLKLYALDALMQMEPGKAVPVLERLLAQDSSPRIKQRALFVLSQSDSPRAREILVRTAKSGQPVSLRCEAVKNLGIAGEPADLAALAEIARDTSAPPEVRNAVIEAYLVADRPDDLAGIATSDPDPRIRAKAIDALGAIGALPALRRLWTTEKDPELREKLLQAFGVAGDVDTLAKAARESSDPELRRKAIEGLGVAGDPAANRALRQLYGEFKGLEDKKKVVEALMVQGDAKALVELFRAEKDPALKRVIIQNLSVMDDPEAMSVILDVLGEKR